MVRMDGNAFLKIESVARLSDWMSCDGGIRRHDFACSSRSLPRSCDGAATFQKAELRGRLRLTLPHLRFNPRTPNILKLCPLARS
jgi:hypothetical protein